MKTDLKFYQSIADLAAATGFLLVIPLVAMQYTAEVVWTLSDFVVAGTLLFGTGLTYKLITRKSGELAYRVAVGFTILTGLFLVWANLAVGMIGSEDNPVNLMYFGVLGIGIIGAFKARFQSQGMVWALCAIIVALVLVLIIALLTGMQHSVGSSVVEIVAVNGFFITLFAITALLFRYAAQKNVSATDTEN